MLETHILSWKNQWKLCLATSLREWTHFREETQKPISLPQTITRGRLEKKELPLGENSFQDKHYFGRGRKRISFNHQNKSGKHERVARKFWSMLQLSRTPSPSWRLMWCLQATETAGSEAYASERGKCQAWGRQQQWNSLRKSGYMNFPVAE